MNAGLDTPTAEARATDSPSPLETLFRRRRFLVDRRYQLRMGLFTGGVALILLVLLNVSLFVAARETTQSAAASTPELRDLVRSQDRIQLMLTLLGSAVFLVGIVVVGVLESHRTAGAAYRLERVIGRLREGNWASRARLRRGDHLQSLATALNQLAATLQDQDVREAEALEEAAARIQGLNEPVAAEIAAAVRRLAITRRQRSA